MSNVITAKIDVTMIDKARLFQGKRKNKIDKLPQYLDIVLMPTQPTQFGDDRDTNTHMVVQSVSKEERENGIRGNILGNAKELSKRGDSQQRRNESSAAPAAAPESDGPPENDDVPF